MGHGRFDPGWNRPLLLIAAPRHAYDLTGFLLVCSKATLVGTGWVCTSFSGEEGLRKKVGMMFRDLQRRFQLRTARFCFKMAGSHFIIYSVRRKTYDR